MLHVEGEVETPRTLTFDELAALPRQVMDGGTLGPGKRGGAVWLDAVLAAGPLRFYVVDAKACGADSGVDACANVKRLGRIRLTLSRASDVGHDHA